MAARLSGKLAHAGVEGGRFAATCRAAHQYDARRFDQQAVKDRSNARVDSEVIQPCELACTAEQAEYGSLAVKRGKRAQAHLDGRCASRIEVRRSNTPLLRPVGAVGQQPGKDLQSRDHAGADLGRQYGGRLQYAVQTQLQRQSVGSRLKMDIAGAKLSGGRHQGIDGAHGIIGLGRLHSAEKSPQFCHVRHNHHLPSDEGAVPSLPSHDTNSPRDCQRKGRRALRRGIVFALRTGQVPFAFLEIL